MIQSALLVLAADRLVERQVGSLFCRQAQSWLRERCLSDWRRRPQCGCGPR
jgi:hypothetical protein